MLFGPPKKGDGHHGTGGPAPAGQEMAMAADGAAGERGWAVFLAGLLVGGVLMAGGFAIGQWGDIPAPGGRQPAAQEPEPVSVEVMMMNFQFDPDPVEVPVGSTVTWVNHDAVYHTVTSDQSTGPLQSPDIQASQSWSFTFTAKGDYYYHCVPHATLVDSHSSGRAYSGMVGLVRITGGGSGPSPEEQLPPAATVQTPEIGRDPADVPPPITRTNATTVEVSLYAQTLIAAMDEGVTYSYWTFNGTVPGPMLRVLEGDTVVLHLENRDSAMTHSIDLHAVMGPGGGATVMQVAPGQTATFTFKAMRAGVYVYHCATPPVDWHIANGMYGLIVVEPPGGLPPVDREYYVVQGEFYTNGDVGEAGHHSMDPDSLHLEEPTYVLFNGRKGSLTGARALTADVNDTVRIFFGVGGPNLVSSFHVIGQIFDRVYDEADLVSAPLQNVQTTLVPAGGVTVVEFVTLVPGTYVLVDHSISRTIYRGSLGLLTVAGPENTDVFHTG
jgi:nitrite reductase (NO-forming)